MQGITAIQGARRAADYLNFARQFMINLKQIIDVAKPGGADGNTVFEQQESAAGPGSGEHRRANGSEMFLTIAATDPDPGQTVEYFRRVGRRSAKNICLPYQATVARWLPGTTDLLVGINLNGWQPLSCEGCRKQG